ncbi:hypothetical protein Ancab_008451 [Ancistrocladus abbreviatus]
MVVIIGMFWSVGGARPLVEDFHVANDDISMYEMARNNLAYWLQRLAHGPSDGGGMFSSVDGAKLLNEDFGGANYDLSVHKVVKNNLVYWL